MHKYMNECVNTLFTTSMLIEFIIETECMYIAFLLLVLHPPIHSQTSWT